MTDDHVAALEQIRQLNIAAGLCPDCGGAGEVYDLRKIHLTGDPHAGKRCPTCRGTGKPKVAALKQETG